MEAVKEVKMVPLGPGRMKSDEYMRVNYDVYVPVGTRPEDIENPDFWSLYAEKFTNHYDELRVICDDGSWLARCIVLQHARTWAKVKILETFKLDQVEDYGESDAYEVAWKGPVNKWCVLRKSDGDILKKQLPSREDAHTWMTEHEKL